MGRSAVGLRGPFRTSDLASGVRLRLSANRTYAQPGRGRGFTLVELVMVILLLGVMATFTSQFIGIGTEIYGDASRREQLMSDARFAMERLNRELRDAVPGSVRVEEVGGALVDRGTCLRFWPIATASRYLSLNNSVSGSTNTKLTIVASSASELPADKDWAVVYPITGEGGLNAGCVYGSCVAEVVGDSSFEPTTKVGTVTVNAIFANDSPAKRIYSARREILYCVKGNSLWREDISLVDGISKGALMAEHIRPADSYFYRDPAAFSPSEVGLRLVFERDDERVIFNHKLEVLNVP